MKLLITFNLLLISLFINAQSNVDVFKPDDYKEEFAPSQVNFELKNCVKWNMGMLTRGVFMVDYERVVSKYFTVEGGIGMTYHDYIYELFNEDAEFLSGYDNDYTVDGGIAVECGLRFYPGEVSSFDGFYLAANYRYRTYNFTVNEFHNYNYDYGYEQVSNSEPFEYGYRMSEFGIQIGYQVESWFDVITWDYYFGLMYRTGTVDDYNYDTNKITEKEDKGPFLVMGFKLGVPFK